MFGVEVESFLAIIHDSQSTQSNAIITITPKL